MATATGQLQIPAQAVMPPCRHRRQLSSLIKEFISMLCISTYCMYYVNVITGFQIGRFATIAVQPLTLTYSSPLSGVSCMRIFRYVQHDSEKSTQASS